jgi:hypothetical protein
MRWLILHRPTFFLRGTIFTAPGSRLNDDYSFEVAIRITEKGSFILFLR